MGLSGSICIADSIQLTYIRPVRKITVDRENLLAQAGQASPRGQLPHGVHNGQAGNPSRRQISLKRIFFF